MGLLRSLKIRLRRRPVDPARVLARAQADARRRALREPGTGHGWSGSGGFGDGGL